MTSLLKGIVAVVTGGSSGNGRAIAQRFALEGAKAIIVADLIEKPREGGQPTAEVVRALGADAEFIQADVSKISDLKRIIDAAERFGGVTVMVNNAGILGAGSALDVTEEEFDRMMAINVKSAFFGSQLAAASMIKNGVGGSIINMSSVAGLEGVADLPVYSTTKGALKLMTYSLAGAFGGDGIRVNAIHPGVIETAMTTTDADIANKVSAAQVPLRRNGRAEEVADAAVYLASSLSSYVSASSIIVDGGMYNSNVGATKG